MTTLHIDLDDDVVSLLRQSNQPANAAAREMIVLELYRRGSISGGKRRRCSGWAAPTSSGWRGGSGSLSST